jgi:transposase
LTFNSRDRGNEYIEAIRQGAPNARPVADRWHLLVNFGDAVEQFFLHQTAHLKEVAALLHTQAAATASAGRAAPTLDGASVTGRAQRSQTKESARMGALYTQVQALHAEGVALAVIAREVQISRRTVYRYLAMDAPPPPRLIQVRDRHVLAPWKPYLIQRWNEGCRNCLELWRDLRDHHAFPYSSRTVARFLTVLRQDSGVVRSFRAAPAQPIYNPTQERKRPLSAGQARRLWLTDPADLKPWQDAYRQMLCAIPQVATAYALTQQFRTLIRERQQQAVLDQWIADAQASGIGPFRTFAAGLLRDYEAVTAAVTEVWSQGQTEAQVHRLKLLKRAMFGQAGFTLLRNRVLYRTPAYQPKERSDLAPESCS